MSRSAPFTQTDVARFLKGAAAAGVQLDQVEIAIERGTGNIVLRPASRAAERAGDNEWDVVLQRDKASG